MTFRQDVTIDWTVSPRIITVLSPSTEILIQDLYDTLRVHESYLFNSVFSKIIEAGGLEELGGGVSVNITATLLDAKLSFQARSGPTWVQCKISGGNLVAKDASGAFFPTPIQNTNFVNVDRAASSSATLLDAGTIETGVAQAVFKKLFPFIT